MNDLISRQMLLEYIHGEPVGRLLCDKYNLDGLIKQFPSARPEKRTEERTETHACDLISRQAAIDAIFGRSHEIIKIRIGNLPSVQPDEEKISDALYNIYRNKGTSTSAEGVAAIKYYIAEIWREIFGEEGPGWMKK